MSLAAHTVIDARDRDAVRRGALPRADTATARGLRSVLLCIRTPNSGIFRHVYDLASQFVRRGIGVGMVVGSDTSIAPDIGEENVRASAPLGIWSLPISRAFAARDAMNFAKVASIARRLDVDIIHGHGAKGGAYARFAGKVLGKPAIYSPHGGSLHFSPKRLSGRVVFGLERALLSVSSGVVFDTNASMGVFREKVAQPRCPVAIIPNGLHDSDFRPADAAKQRFDFTYFGRIVELKGVDVLLRAAARIERAGRTCRIGIFGIGQDLEKFRALATSLKLDNVEWCGWAETTRDALEAGRCLVVPSRFDSMPYAVIEGAAMGVPMVASGVGGIPEILGPDHPVVPADDDLALANQMIAVLDNPVEAAQRARRLRLSALERFRVEDMADRMLAFYRTAASGTEGEQATPLHRRQA